MYVKNIVATLIINLSIETSNYFSTTNYKLNDM